VSFVVHRAERADVLVAALAEVLAVAPADAFAPEVVAVHSRGVERWLTNQLAARLGTSPGRSDGVCANLRFPFPGNLVGDALARASGLERSADRWRPERLAWPLLEVVDANMGEPWLEVLAAHLGGADAGAIDRDRRFGAVRHLGDLFDSYAVHRPSMVLAWAAGRNEDGNGRPLPADVAWQAELWRQLRLAVGTPGPAERLAGGCAALVDDPGLVDLPGRLSLFGFTRLPASYLDVLRALATARDVHVLALHPSPAAWSNLSQLSSSDGEEAADRVHHPLLRAWGRDSREMQLVLADRLSGTHVTHRHHPLPPATPTTLLQRVQAAIRADEPPGAGSAPVLDPGDRSVQVHACHSRARQAEVVRGAITHLLADDPTLEPRDIVVLCPDIDELAPLLHAAFGGQAAGDPAHQPPAIPYRLADRSLRQTNPVLGAVAEVLALVDARITASQVLALAGLAPVRERFRLDDDDLARIAAWVGATGTRWGLDAGARAPYDLAEVEAGTWDAGLVRLLLGVTMSEDDHRLVGGALPLDDVDAGDIPLAGRFTELIARLGAVVRDMEVPRPLPGWAAAINSAADLLLATRSADAWQRSQLDRLLAEVLAEAGAAPASGEEAPSGAPLRLTEIRDLLADRLRGQPTRAAFRTGDLTMCTLVPMRSVPHRVICLVGLDDGAFPRAGAPDGDDVLARARHVGDHDRRAEDRQLLLDAVLAAGDALVVTYQGRDERTNELLPPAVPVNELLEVIDAAVTTTTGAPARLQLVQHHPLQPSDARCFVPGELGTTGPWGFDPALLAGARAASGPRRQPGPFLPGPLPPLPATEVALADLVRFAEHPAKAFLSQRLGLSLWTEGDRPADAVAVELDSLAAWGVGDRLVTALLAGGDIESACAAEVARGMLPPGALGRDALVAARGKAEAIAAAAQDAAAGAPTSLDVDVALPDGRRLVGTVPGVVGTVVRSTTFSRLGPKHQIGAWVRFLAATAAHPDLPLWAATIGRDRDGAKTVLHRPLAGTPEGRLERAVTLLSVVVDLRDRGLREPLPLYTDTSHRYAAAVRAGHEHPEDEAERGWTSEWRWDKEDRDAAHLRVLGGERPFAEVLAEPPRPDEDGPGWAVHEQSRFGRLARRLWDPFLDASAGRPA
jgi:exodeoxyribonuclease V gamma subunit